MSTEDNLKQHIYILFTALLNLHSAYAWKCKLNEHYFIAGLFTAESEQISYKLPIKYWNLLEKIKTLDSLPTHDGHTKKDNLYRLNRLIKYFYSSDNIELVKKG